MPSTPSDITPDTRRAPVPQLNVEPQNGPLQDTIDAAIVRVCRSGRFVHGPDCHELEQAIANYCGTRHAIGCASGSDALLLALMALEIGAGDEVILPSFTFFATAGAVSRLGANPVFVDIDPTTFNIDPVRIVEALTPATRAILPVHLFGQAADMSAIQAIAQEKGLPVVEDAAQAIGAEHRGRRVGSIGTFGCFSFYPTKNLGGFGDGGMITTNDDRMAEKLRILRDHGQHPRYHHALVGVNSRLDSIQAAVLNVKLNRLDMWTTQRGDVADRYDELLRQRGLDQAVQLPKIPAEGRHVWNQYTLRVPDGHRDPLAAHLADGQIGSAIYYPVPLHLQKCFAPLGYREGSLPETERATEEVLSLPIYPGLTAEQQAAVVDRMADYWAEKGPGESHAVKGPNFLKRSRTRDGAPAE